MSASVAEPGSAAAAVPQVCLHCRKSFPRLCDLNKHAKSHSRPFKCAVEGCKYYEHGWPTAKELERHVNDKHSIAPRTFRCAFTPCAYESKRESNCKQHMEKKHGWDYQRSKSNGKRLLSQQHQTDQPRVGPIPQQAIPSASTDPGHRAASIPFKPAMSGPSFGSDFVLFADETEPPIILGHSGEDLVRNYEDGDDDESRVFLPWNSPTTRMLKNQSMLDMFTEAYNRPPDKTLGQPDAMIDPSLRQYNQLSTPAYQQLDKHRLPAIDTSVKAEPPSLGFERFSWNGGSDTGSAPADSPSDGRRNPSTAYSSQFHTPHSAGVDFTGTPAQPAHMGWNQANLRRRGSDEDDHRPEKKLKSGREDDFTDTTMPDIFRHAHPQIYDRDQKEKYSPCHSSHRDISTLVRHLGRPAHRLTVTKEAISSFDIEDEDYPHPRVGVCRRCWRQFFHRHDFDEHTNSDPCEKVSKGKREKWQVLHDSFTPLVDLSTDTDNLDHASLGVEGADVPTEPPRSPSRQSGFFAAGVQESHWDEPASPAESVASPTSFFPKTSSTSDPAHDGALVPMEDYERLQREHNDLRQKHQQLEKMANALLVAQVYQSATLGSVDQGSSDGPLTAGTSGQLLAAPAEVSRRQVPPRLSAPPGSSSKDNPTSDRDRLVLHMGSQPPEVDIDGLLNEPHETLSRQNSGLSSTSRSTVHHVNTSPPPLPPAEYEASGENRDVNQPTRAAKPPTSIPDSGYASVGNHRHGSFGEISAMPGDFHYQRGHHRHTSSLSTLNYQHDHNHPPPAPPGGIPWRLNTLGPGPAPGMGPGQPVSHDQQHHTFIAQPQPAAQAPAHTAEPSFDDSGLQFLEDLDFFGNM